jgi:dUTP pyrophosphatase
LAKGGERMGQADVPADVLVTRVDPDVPLPSYAHPGDAGADLVAAEDVDLAPGERAVVRTGVAIALPDGYAGFVHPRSGLAARYGVTIVNAPGTIDAGYRGEIKVILQNTDPASPVSFCRGDRIAQLVVQRVEYVTFREVDALPCSVRGEGGFGSTGGHAAGVVQRIAAAAAQDGVAAAQDGTAAAQDGVAAAQDGTAMAAQD